MFQERLRLALMITVLTAVMLPFNSCGLIRTDTLRSTELGNPMSRTNAAPTLLTSVCTVLDRCRSDVSLTKCLSGVSSTSGLASSLGLTDVIYGNYSSVVSAEGVGAITANPVAANRCM